VVAAAFCARPRNKIRKNVPPLRRNRCRQIAVEKGGMMLPNGHYRTAAGSEMWISGEHSGISAVEFDWIEEEHACINCQALVYEQEGYLVWRCEYCGGGRAALTKVEE